MQTTHELFVFHDETEFQAGEKYKGYVLFFVPEALLIKSSTPMFGTHELEVFPIEQLKTQIVHLRSMLIDDDKFHYSRISGKRWHNNDSIKRLVLERAIDALRTKRPKVFSNPLCCKLAIIFFSNSTDLSLYGGEQSKERRLRHHETILRIILKGALHYLYDDDDQVIIKGLISDGDPFHRSLSDSRVVWDILYDEFKGRSPLKPNITFSEDASIIQMDSNHRNYDLGSIDWIRANLLQIADLLLGATIKSCHIGCKDHTNIPKPGTEVEDKKGIFAYPIKRLYSKEKRGVGFTYSGHYRSFTISFIDFSGDTITFKPVRPVDIQLDDMNLELPFES